jgi:hypothetical protein
VQQTENAPIADALLDPLHQPLVWDGVEGSHHTLPISVTSRVR